MGGRPLEDLVLEVDGSAICREIVSDVRILASRQSTYRLGELNVNLGHADERTIEVLDCLAGLLRSFVANIANSPLRENLDVGNMTSRAKMFP